MTLLLKVDCRACNRECDQFKHLLENTIIDDEVKTFDALLSYCTTLEGFVENHESGMPQHICNSCVERLFQSYLFKKMVLQNETAYRKRLLAQEKSKKAVMVASVKEEQVVKQEIDIEEFISENKEFVEDNNVEPEYNCQEWEQIDKDYQPSVSESNNKQSERHKNDFVENISIDNVEYSNDIVVINEADAENYEYVNVSDAKEYNDNKYKICAQEKLSENSNENKDKTRTSIKKMERISKQQKQMLVNHMASNLEFARGQFDKLNSTSSIKEQWESLKNSLNSLGGSEKSVEQWKKCWTDLKVGVKKTISTRRKFMNKTDGGSCEDVPRDLNNLEEQILQIITVDDDSCTPESGIKLEESKDLKSNEFLDCNELYVPPTKKTKMAQQLPLSSSEKVVLNNFSPTNKSATKYADALSEARSMQNAVIKQLNRIEQQNSEILEKLDRISATSSAST